MFYECKLFGWILAIGGFIWLAAFNLGLAFAVTLMLVGVIVINIDW